MAIILDIITLGATRRIQKEQLEYERIVENYNSLVRKIWDIQTTIKDKEFTLERDINTIMENIDKIKNNLKSSHNITKYTESQLDFLRRISEKDILRKAISYCPIYSEVFQKDRVKVCSCMMIPITGVVVAHLEATDQINQIRYEEANLIREIYNLNCTFNELEIIKNNLNELIVKCKNLIEFC